MSIEKFDEKCLDSSWHWNYKYDFYFYMEECVSNRIDLNIEILSKILNNNYEIMKQFWKDDEKKVDYLISQIKQNDLNNKIFAKALFCYCSQFDHIDLLEKISQEFNYVESIANLFELTNNNFNTLQLTVRSNSLKIIEKCCDEWGANLNYKYSFSSNKTILNYSFHNEMIFGYLLEKIDSNLIDFVSLLNDFLSSNSTNERIVLLILDFGRRKSNQIDLSSNLISNLCQHLVFSKDVQIKHQIYKIMFEWLNLKSSLLSQKCLIHVLLNDSISDKLLFEYLFIDIFDRDQSILVNLINEKLKTSSNDLYSLDYLFKYLDDKSKVEYDEINTNDLSSNVGIIIKSKLDVEHPFFYKQIILVKYGIIKRDMIICALNNYIEKWSRTVTSKMKLYQSGCTIKRYLSANELIELVLNYYEYLVKNGYLLTNLNLNLKEIIPLHDHSILLLIKEYETKFEKLNEIRLRNSLNLKHLCINAIRDNMRSMSEISLKQLGLSNQIKLLQ